MKTWTFAAVGCGTQSETAIDGNTLAISVPLQTFDGLVATSDKGDKRGFEKPSKVRVFGDLSDANPKFEIRDRLSDSVLTVCFSQTSGFATPTDLFNFLNSTLCDAGGGSGGSPTGAAGGDLAGNFPNPTIGKFQNQNVALTSPTTGQILKWNGSAWVNSAPTDAVDEVVQAAGVPTVAPTATQGNLYIDTATGKLYSWDGSAWNETGRNVDEVIEGSGVPVAAPTGDQNGLYRDTATGILYVWSGSAWVNVSEDKKMLSASGDPLGALGIVGDHYINESTGSIWEKTGASTWTQIQQFTAFRGVVADNAALVALANPKLEQTAYASNSASVSGGSSGQAAFVRYNGTVWQVYHLVAPSGSSEIEAVVGTASVRYQVLTGTPVLSLTKTGGSGIGTLAVTGGTIKLKRFADIIAVADQSAAGMRYDLVGTGTNILFAIPHVQKRTINVSNATADASTNATVSNQFDVDNTPSQKYGNISLTGQGAITVRFDTIPSTDTGIDLIW